ncbi:DUF4843 domain-containing protein [Sphingobacterium griseoflavum]|uniref:DUF4843 domain-containing protein n=1 Tax=Sphingobacterium griseoflavum TaxID=1474952 RepID=A0ABQ3HVA4_9SPHI|nr:DUF4843 domain-containing protein [Sphingobacterium griseoflavum]GHE29879.1 hypothetical protein GCM10017764_11170 [Sphingobacterium griseoflavum]
MPLFDGEPAIFIGDGQSSVGRVLNDQDAFNTITSFRTNFAFKRDEIITDTIRIPLRVSGRLSAEDRPVSISVVAQGTDAVEGRDFQILPTVIPANKSAGQALVVLHRNASLGEDPKRLLLQVMTNEHFPRYMYADSINVYNQVEIFMLDVFRKPDNWDGIYVNGEYREGSGLGFTFGDYSETKFRLIIEYTGVAEIISFIESPRYNRIDPKPPGYLSSEQWTMLNYRLQLHLVRYRQENGRPLLDENGQEITFPILPQF